VAPFFGVLSLTEVFVVILQSESPTMLIPAWATGAEAKPRIAVAAATLMSKKWGMSSPFLRTALEAERAGVGTWDRMDHFDSVITHDGSSNIDLPIGLASV
jgi:hypothetical protein